jgi:hypothetical protein
MQAERGIAPIIVIIAVLLLVGGGYFAVKKIAPSEKTPVPQTELTEETERKIDIEAIENQSPATEQQKNKKENTLPAHLKVVAKLCKKSDLGIPHVNVSSDDKYYALNFYYQVYTIDESGITIPAGPERPVIDSETKFYDSAGNFVASCGGLRIEGYNPESPLCTTTLAALVFEETNLCK